MKLVGIGSVEDFARVARELHAAPIECEQLQTAVDLAVALIGGCDHAGVSIVQGRTVCSPASSDDLVRRGDALQYELDEGPCLDSLRLHQTVVSHDLPIEKRWPRWTPQAVAELGIQGMMSCWLSAKTCSYGALNLYADRTNAFEPEDRTNAEAFATQVSIALATQREIYQRSIAMENRTVIGQAEGILMERLGIDADQAFAYLRRTSQAENRKLIIICKEIVQTRRLPSH